MGTSGKLSSFLHLNGLQPVFYRSLLPWDHFLWTLWLWLCEILLHLQFVRHSDWIVWHQQPQLLTVKKALMSILFHMVSFFCKNSHRVLLSSGVCWPAWRCAAVGTHTALALQSSLTFGTTHTSKFVIIWFQTDPETQDFTDRGTDL